MKSSNLKFLFLLLTFSLVLSTCEEDPVILDMNEPGMIDSVIVVNPIVEDEPIFVAMVDILGLWELLYYHGINGPYWDSVADDITHLNLTPNTCYMNTTTGGNILVVDGDWVFEIVQFGDDTIQLKRETEDGWCHLYIFIKIE
jgi:hypothetical protein